LLNNKGDIIAGQQHIFLVFSVFWYLIGAWVHLGSGCSLIKKRIQLLTFINEKRKNHLKGSTYCTVPPTILLQILNYILRPMLPLFYVLPNLAQ